MKKAEIRVGGMYTARVSGNFVTVRVDIIRDRSDHKGYSLTAYDVTNLNTGRKTTFYSAAKFRAEAREPKAVAMDERMDRVAAATVAHDKRQEGEQCGPFAQSVSPTAPSTHASTPPPARSSRRGTTGIGCW